MCTLCVGLVFFINPLAFWPSNSGLSLTNVLVTYYYNVSCNFIRRIACSQIPGLNFSSTCYSGKQRLPITAISLNLPIFRAQQVFYSIFTTRMILKIRSMCDTRRDQGTELHAVTPMRFSVMQLSSREDEAILLSEISGLYCPEGLHHREY